MKLTITALGAAGSEVAGAARRVADYLEGNELHTGRLLGNSVDQAAVYYADNPEGAGQWRGHGAVWAGLDGEVDRDSLMLLLMGRDPTTGERLLTAQGSAGRSDLAVGAYTRIVDGVEVWGADDASVALGVTAAEVQELVDVHHIAGTYAAGANYLTESDMGRLESIIRPDGTTQVADLSDRDPEDWLTVTDAADATGLSNSYLRKKLRQTADRAETIDQSPSGLDGHFDGVQWWIKAGEMQRFMTARKAPTVRIGFDAVLTSEKSVSILAVLGNSRTGQAVRNAVDAATAVAMNHLDDHAARHQNHGGTEGLTIASYQHSTSRNLDPHIHTHNLIINAADAPDGTGRALDGRWLYAEAKPASALATAEMRYQLTRQLGVKWRGTKRGAEIEGITDDMIEGFSSRRTEIREAVNEILGVSMDEADRGDIQHMSATTRPDKVSVTGHELLTKWRATAATVGLTAEHLDSVVGRASTSHYLDPQQQAALHAFLNHPTKGVTAKESTFSWGDVAAVINNYIPEGSTSPIIVPAVELKRLTDTFLQTQQVLPVAAEQLIRRKDGRVVGAAGQQRWTTAGMIATQQQVLDQWHRTRHTHNGHAHPQIVKTVLDSCGLSDEQRHLVEHWTTSGKRFDSAVGRPGTGKTHTVRAAVDVWEAAGYRVIGASVKGTAAQLLGTEANIKSDTVASYLYPYRKQGTNKLDYRTVLVVDEASTISDRDLHTLIKMVNEANATLRLLGDPAQQQSVAAGGLWAEIVSVGDVPELTVQHRLKVTGEITAAEQVRVGNIAEAFTAMAASGQLVTIDDPDRLNVEMVSRWWDRTERGIATPMLHPLNDTRHELNAIAQALRVAKGEVTFPKKMGPVTIGLGDNVIATSPGRNLVSKTDPDLYVTNGAAGTVTEFGLGTITVDFDRLGEITIDNKWIRDGNLALGYAITSYSSQGITVQEIGSAAPAGISAESLYVSLTRGTNVNEVLITQQQLENHQTSDGSDAHQVIAESVATSTPRPAIVADPQLAQPNRELLASHDRARRERAILTNPQPALVKVLPPRPTVPWLAADWDRLLLDLHTSVLENPTGSGVAGLVPQEQLAKLEQHRQTIIEIITRYTHNTTKHSAMSGWLPNYISQRAFTVDWGTVSYPKLGEWVQQQGTQPPPKLGPERVVQPVTPEPALTQEAIDNVLEL